MIETMLAKAAAHIQLNVAAVSKSGGVAQVIQMRSGNRTRKVPAVPDGNGGYMDLLPDDGQSAVAFWHVLSVATDTRLRSHNPLMMPMEAKVRLIVWGNKKRLSPPDVLGVLGECIREAKRADMSEDWIQAINMHPTAVDHQNKIIFSMYDFDEVETQFLTEPYDFASAIFEIQYSVLVTCMPPVAAVQTNC